MKNNQDYPTPEQIEIYERYLMHQMNASERIAFEVQLAEDEVLDHSFREFKEMVFVVEEAALKERMADYHSIDESKEAKEVILQRPTRTNYLIAASVVLLIGLGGVWFLNVQNQNLFEEYFTPDPGLPTLMGNSSDYTFYEAMIDYKRENYTSAIEKWEKLLHQNTENDTLNYFIGSANLASGNVENSIVFLEKTAQNETSVFYDEANFYLGLIYLKLGEEDKAIPLLRKSHHKGGKELLDKLED